MMGRSSLFNQVAIKSKIMTTTDDRLESFLKRNKISKRDLAEAIHTDILQTLLGRVCEFCKSPSNFRRVKERFLTNQNDVETSGNIVKYITGYTLESDDCNWMTKCILAFLNSRGKGRDPSITKKYKNTLWESQHHKCAYCGKELSIKEFHVDHIIPFDYVGDELAGNYQGLCKRCNSEKTNHVGLALKYKILSKQGIWKNGKS